MKGPQGITIHRGNKECPGLGETSQHIKVQRERLLAQFMNYLDQWRHIRQINDRQGDMGAHTGNCNQ
jgi:hypothetical protein